MCQTSDSVPNQCNRQPFLSESGCYRGDVDIHQFDDLPYCGTINPTPPDIPPEVVDGPIPIPLPTFTCTCVNIRHKFKMQYNDRRRFHASASFKASGDCCEGRYNANFDLQIPCPVIKDDAKIKIGISYGSGPQDASGSFLNTDSKSCMISPVSPSFKLNIPCPVVDSKKKIKVGLSYGTSFKGASAEFIKANRDSCTIEALEAKINLNIPCPVNNTGKRLKVGISYGSGPQDASASVIKASESKCTVEAVESRINLNIPCPISSRRTRQPQALLADGVRIVQLGNGGIDPVSYGKYEVKYEYFQYSDSWLVIAPTGRVSFTRLNGQSNYWMPSNYWTTNGSYSVPHIQKNGRPISLIPSVDGPLLVVDGADGNTQHSKGEGIIRVGIGYGSSGLSYGYAQMAEFDREKCTIAPMSPSINLSIPCPVKTNIGKKKIKASIKYGSSGSSVSASFANKGESCSLSLYGGTDHEVKLNLAIPCPVKTSPGKKKIKASIKYGSSGSSVSASFANKGDSCSLSLYGGEGHEIKLDLAIPCPIKTEVGKKKIKASIKYGSSGSSVSAPYASVGNSCSLSLNDEVKLNLQIPCPLKNLAFETETKTEGSVGSFKMEEISASGSGCARKFKVSVVFPAGGGGGGDVGSGWSGDRDVIEALSYAQHSLKAHVYRYTYAKGRLVRVVDKSWTTVFTAVPHMGSC